MPYIIYVPAIPRPYITNDPRIYIDCSKVFGWTCESRPFSDSYCKDARAKEDVHDEGDRRRDQLEQYWVAELKQRERLRQEAEAGHVKVLVKVKEPSSIAQSVSTTPIAMFGKHDKRDSVLSVLIEVQGSVDDIVEDTSSDVNEVPAPWISLKHLTDQREFSLEMAGGSEGNHALV